MMMYDPRLCYILDGVLGLYGLFITGMFIREKVSTPAHTHTNTHSHHHTWKWTQLVQNIVLNQLYLNDCSSSRPKWRWRRRWRTIASTRWVSEQTGTREFVVNRAIYWNRALTRADLLLVVFPPGPERPGPRSLCTTDEGRSWERTREFDLKT